MVLLVRLGVRVHLVGPFQSSALARPVQAAAGEDIGNRKEHRACHAVGSGSGRIGTFAFRRHRQPAIGTDIKVMGVRRGSEILLTVGCAFIDRFFASIDEYVRCRDFARSLALDTARRVTGLAVDVVVNAADDVERRDVFLTVTGTSAEAGDDGEVGRGNRTSGLITPYRSMTLEAAAGKNPVSHIGKLYNLAAGRIAANLAERLGTGVDVSCVLVSQIGRPVDDPQVSDVRIAGRRARHFVGLEALVRETIAAELSQLPELREELLAGRVNLY